MVLGLSAELLTIIAAGALLTSLVEEAFKRAWYGIMKELPNQYLMNASNTDKEGSGSLENDKHADSRNLTNSGVKAG